MYEIRPESIKGFIEDTNIKLPRFQRKQTWDDKKNFQLCISIFKEYPIGVSILNIEKNNGTTTRWLLDGRQRRNALTQFYRDPENIYLWAKKFIGFKANDQLFDLEEKFWVKINEYLEEDELEEEVVVEEEDLEEERDVVSEDSLKYSTEKSGLDLLLYIVKLVHNKTNKHSGFTRPFDFSKEIPNLSYLIIKQNGIKTLSSQKLKSFIGEYKNYCSNELVDYNEEVNFTEFIKYRFPTDEKTTNKLKIKISQNWESIFERIDILDKVNNLYMNSKIGLIEVKNLRSVDAQKIFNIINSEGTKLSAVEILSAKPSWNIPITNATQKQIDITKKLYSKINVVNNDVVKWDLSATFISRLENKELLFKNFTDSKTDFSKEITLGFKFLAGVFQKGVTKDDIDKLGRNKDINWSIDYESLINDLNLVSKLICSSEYFKYLKSWKFSLLNTLSDAIALNFLLLMYQDWTRKGKPIGTDTKVKQFQKNAFILLDNLIYEYITKKWRGSSDSKIARNINNFNNENDVIKPLDKNKWSILIKEILDDNKIDSNPISQSIIQPLLYHFYAIIKLQGPDSNYKIDVDHIIPQSAFKASTLDDKEVLMHNLFNLALLPKDENISKSNKYLKQITDNWLIDQIEKYTFITEDDFKKYSDLNNLNDLKNMRGDIFLDAYENKRNLILNN